MTLRTDGDAGTLYVSGCMDIESANTLRETLLQCLAKQSELIMDLSEVEASDTAALQVLLACQKDCAAMSKTFKIAAVSVPVAILAANLGLPLSVAAA